MYDDCLYMANINFGFCHEDVVASWLFCYEECEATPVGMKSWGQVKSLYR
jgi:hypothetical protein